MSGKASAAAGLLVALVLVGMAAVPYRDADGRGRIVPRTHQNVPENSVAVTTGRQDRDELLTPVEAPPPEPPVVTLVAEDPSSVRDSRSRIGILYRAEWLRDGKHWKAPAPREVRWNMPMDAVGLSQVLLRIPPAAKPSLLTIYGFTRIDSAEEPVGRQVYEVECDRQALMRRASRCTLTTSPREVKLLLRHLPQGVLHLAVGISWLETGSTTSGERVLYDSGTWLFTLRT